MRTLLTCNNLRTKRNLSAQALEIATMRQDGATLRAIAAITGGSRSGVHDLLKRLGINAMRFGGRRSGRLSRRAIEAIAILTHSKSRRLTWRQRVALQGRVVGATTRQIAADLGITPEGVRDLVGTARKSVVKPWRRTCHQNFGHSAIPDVDLDALAHDSMADLVIPNRVFAPPGHQHPHPGHTSDA